jgi:hypothetical protein
MRHHPGLTLVAVAVAVTCLLGVLPALAAGKKVHVAVGVDAPEQEADRYLAANLQLVQKDTPRAVQQCAKQVEPSPVGNFELAVEVGKDGKPGKTVATPSNKFTECVAKAVTTLRFTAPPRAPLGVYFEVTFGD